MTRRQAVATGGVGWPCPRHPFRFAQNTFLEHQVTTRQQTIMEKGIITFKHNNYSRLKFSQDSLLNCWQSTAMHKCDAIIRIIDMPLRMCREREM